MSYTMFQDRFIYIHTEYIAGFDCQADTCIGEDFLSRKRHADVCLLKCILNQYVSHPDLPLFP